MEKVTEFKSRSFYITTEKHSWSLFNFTDKGDLTITGDWGCYGYSWRTFGGDFTEFLKGINEDYLISNLSSNLNYMYPNGANKIFGKNKDSVRAKAIKALFLEFQNHLNTL